MRAEGRTLLISLRKFVSKNFSSLYEFLLGFLFTVSALLNLAFTKKEFVSCERLSFSIESSSANFGKCVVFAEIIMDYKSQIPGIQLL